MAETELLESQPRTKYGSHAAEKLRKQGLVPAVLYGHREATVPLTLPRDALSKAIRRGSRVLDLKLESGTQKALISEVQWDHLGMELLHVDFTRVDVDERIEVTVPLEVRGTAPGVTAGGVLDQPMHSLSVECLAISIPQSIRVNVGELQIGQAIHVRDLTLPEGVKALSDPDAVVIHVSAPVEEAAAAGAAPAGEQAEPEVIGRKATEGEGEAE